MNTPLTLLVIITIFCLLFQKSKLLTVLCFFFIWTLAWTTKQPDYANYQLMFDNSDATDLGFRWLTNFAKSFKLDYFTFRLIFLAIGWSIYCWFVLKYAKRCSLTAIIYLWTGSLYDMVQNRNFVAFSICLIGICYLFKTQKMTTRRQIVYAGFVLLASSIHVTCAFFLILLIFNKITINKFSPVQIGFICLVAVIVFYYIFSDIVTEKILNYDTGVSVTTKFAVILLFTLNLAFIRYARNYNPRNNKVSCSDKDKMYLTTLQNNTLIINSALLLLLPAAFMSMSALRVYRYIGIINFSYVTNKIKSQNTIKSLFLTLLILVYSSSFFIVVYMMHLSSFMLVIFPPFYDNIFYSPFLK